MGDINIDYSENCKFTKFLKTKGYQQLIQKATCNTGSLIDHIYVNESLRSLNISISQCSAHYSDHDIISLYVPK